MRKAWKRSLALLLCVCMAFSVMAIPAFADDFGIGDGGISTDEFDQFDAWYVDNIYLDYNTWEQESLDAFDDVEVTIYNRIHMGIGDPYNSQEELDTDVAAMKEMFFTTLVPLSDSTLTQAKADYEALASLDPSAYTEDSWAEYSETLTETEGIIASTPSASAYLWCAYLLEEASSGLVDAVVSNEDYEPIEDDVVFRALAWNEDGSIELVEFGVDDTLGTESVVRLTTTQNNSANNYMGMARDPEGNLYLSTHAVSGDYNSCVYRVDEETWEMELVADHWTAGNYYGLDLAAGSTMLLGNQMNNSGLYRTYSVLPYYDVDYWTTMAAGVMDESGAYYSPAAVAYVGSGEIWDNWDQCWYTTDEFISLNNGYFYYFSLYLYEDYSPYGTGVGVDYAVEATQLNDIPYEILTDVTEASMTYDEETGILFLTTGDTLYGAKVGTDSSGGLYVSGLAELGSFQGESIYGLTVSSGTGEYELPPSAFDSGILLDKISDPDLAVTARVVLPEDISEEELEAAKGDYLLDVEYAEEDAVTEADIAAIVAAVDAEEIDWEKLDYSYLDIALSRKTTSIDEETGETVESWETVTDPAFSVTISLGVPEAVGGYDEYVVVRLHDGKADVVDSTYSAGTDTITFTTDKFSVYVIVGVKLTVYYVSPHGDAYGIRIYYEYDAETKSTYRVYNLVQIDLETGKYTYVADLDRTCGTDENGEDVTVSLGSVVGVGSDVYMLSGNSLYKLNIDLDQEICTLSCVAGVLDEEGEEEGYGPVGLGWMPSFGSGEAGSLLMFKGSDESDGEPQGFLVYDLATGEISEYKMSLRHLFDPTSQVGTYLPSIINYVKTIDEPDSDTGKADVYYLGHWNGGYAYEYWETELYMQDGELTVGYNIALGNKYLGDGTYARPATSSLNVSSYFADDILYVCSSMEKNGSDGTMSGFEYTAILALDTVHYASDYVLFEDGLTYGFVGWLFDYTPAEHVHSWVGTVTKEATCTEDGQILYVCECGESYVEVIPATGHTVVTDAAADPTCTEPGLTEGSHCAVCGEVLVAQEVLPAAGHVWDDGVVTAEPTEDAPGEITYTCTVCGATYTETIAPITHVWDDGVVTVEPTCTTPGEILYTCLDCGLTYTAEIPATGHAWDDGVVTAEPTCTESGAMVCTCTVCGETYTVELPATGHNWTLSEVTVEPTCTARGEIICVCTVCGETYVYGVPATGHVWDDGVVTLEPTEDAVGEITYTCTVCGATRVELIDPLGASSGSGTLPTDDGTTPTDGSAADGSGEGDGEVTAVTGVDTADTAPVYLAMLLAFCAAAACILLIFRRKRA